MNILQILPALEVGGVERGTVDLARYLTLNGHKAVVVSGGGKLVRRLDEVGARHYRLPVGKKSPITAIWSMGKLCEIIKKENIDIVHARSRIPALAGFFAARSTNKTFITTAHGYYNMRLTSRPMGWGRFVIVASRDMARHMIEDFKTPYDRIRLIPRGVDLNEFRFMRNKDAAGEKGAAVKKDFIVGMISRITPLKGHTDFLKAIAIAARSIPGLRAYIVGDVPPSKTRYREDLDLLARRLGITNMVNFMGAREDIPDILSQLDILALPTRTPEAFGRVIIEAQAVGVPVAASRVGGIVDVVRDNETGLLCEPEDPRSLAEAIIRVRKDQNFARSLAARARKEVEKKYSLTTMSESTLQVYEEALSLKKILVIKLSALGDVILSIPSLRALRKKFPKAVIKVLVGLPASDALRDCPYINERITYDPRSRDAGFRGLMKIASRLRKEDFDIVVDLQNNKASHLLAFLSAAALRYGYDNGKWSFFLNRKVKGAKLPLEPVEHQFRTLSLLGVDNDGGRLELWPSRHDWKWADDFLKENWVDSKSPLVGINVAASSRWQSKKWETSYIAELCDELAKRYHIRTLLTGAGEDTAAARDIASASGSKPIISAGKTDILQLASLIKRCKVYITTDSAPLHVAAAMGVPFIALFGATDPARHVSASKRHVIVNKKLKCSPCYKPVCKKDNICMKNIKVGDVVTAVDGFLR